MPNRKERRRKQKSNLNAQNRFGMSIGQERKFLRTLSKQKKDAYRKMKEGKTLQQAAEEVTSSMRQMAESTKNLTKLTKLTQMTPETPTTSIGVPQMTGMKIPKMDLTPLQQLLKQEQENL